MTRFAAFLAAASLAAPSSAQVRLVVPEAPLGGFAAPALAAPSLASPALSLSLPAPVLSPSLTPSLAPALTVAPAGLLAGRAYFDGAAIKGEQPALVDPAAAPRGQTVSLNGTQLPARLFSDQAAISQSLIKAIDATTTSLDIAIHGLALREVLAALVRAKNRGVRVRIVMNQTHVFPEKPRDTRTPEVQQLIDLGFEMRMLRGGDAFGVMHNKVAIFDGQILETGSYNWTHAADTWHFENAMFHAEAARVAAYQAYWDWMWSVSSKIPKQAPPIPERPAPDAPRPPPLPAAPQDPSRPMSFNGVRFPAEAFSPGGVTEHLVRAIDASNESIDLAAFSFTSEDLRDALLRAKGRGVKVRAVFDADQYKYLSEMHWFVENGFDVLLSHGKDGEKGVMHDKFAVFDGKFVEAGSFNWTRNGERNNYENAMFLSAPDDVAAYAAAFGRIRAQAFAPSEDDHAGPHSAPDSFSHPDGL